MPSLQGFSQITCGSRFAAKENGETGGKKRHDVIQHDDEMSDDDA